MQNSKKSFSHVGINAFIDFRPAELRTGKRWLIVYYSKNPITGILERQRLSVPMVKSISERKKHAQTIVLEINNKLKQGWLPYYDNTDTNEFKTLDYCIDLFIDYTTKELNKNAIRFDTFRSYKSYTSMIKKFIAEKKLNVKLLLEFKKDIVTKYLDWIYYDRNNSERTYNNHLSFIVTFFNFCVERGFLKQNFAIGIKKKKNQQKVRQVLTPEIKNMVKELEQKNHPYFCVCMLTYFCFIRRTEATKLLVSDVDIFNKHIKISGDNSKNKKTEYVTIPNAFLPILVQHIAKAKTTDFLFSENDFNAGKIQLQPKRISDYWDKFRKEKKIPAIYQFYSLKDTGITDLLNTGIPALKVRDQARHHDLKITESYTARNKSSDEMVQNANFNF